MAKKSGRRTESVLIADQLRRAFYGSAWHGPAMLELLEDVSAKAAGARPIADAHSIWELVLHVEAWDGAAITRLSGKKTQLKGKQNFPVAAELTDKAWKASVKKATRTHDELVWIVSGLSEKRLQERCPGKNYDFYHLLHGVVQHELYHAGQIAILKKMV
jgi:uncharacterized damage-inducible protein DinB